MSKKDFPVPMLSTQQASRLEGFVHHRVGSFRFVGFQPLVPLLQQDMGRVPAAFCLLPI